MTHLHTGGLSVEEFTKRMEHLRSRFPSIQEISDSFAKASVAFNQFTGVTENMELAKLKQEKRVLEDRLRDVIQAELNRFKVEHGLHPVNVWVDIIRVEQFGTDPDYVLSGVITEFGL